MLIDADVHISPTPEGGNSILVDELLRRMGWINQSPVVRFEAGRGGIDADTRSPDEKLRRQSGGNVSDLFKARRPPRASGGSAY